LSLTVSNYANITGKRLFISPNIMSRSITKLKSEEERKYDIVLPNEYRHIDSVEIEIPAGYQPESVPQPVSIQTKFGKYSNDIRISGNKIYYHRVVEQYKGKFASTEYGQMVSYYEAMYKADRNKIVLVKQEGN
jgi:hypothetical protein